MSAELTPGLGPDRAAGDGEPAALSLAFDPSADSATAISEIVGAQLTDIDPLLVAAPGGPFVGLLGDPSNALDPAGLAAAPPQRHTSGPSMGVMGAFRAFPDRGVAGACWGNVAECGGPRLGAEPRAELGATLDPPLR